VTVPILRPGQIDDAVPRLKHALVPQLVALGLQHVAQAVVPDSRTYGPASVAAVEAFQAAKTLPANGTVDKGTWHARGINELVVDVAPVALEGEVIIAPGANLAGKPIQELTFNYLKRMAGMLGKPITVTTGTNHDKFTVNGNVSDHFSGHAADLGMVANGGTNDGPVGDRLMNIALLVGGLSAADATAKSGSGGLFTFTHENQRIQCIWKTDEGGNHHNHVHVGVRPA
jgi:hypothetical protein